MNQTFTFADRLKSAMEQKHMKQVDLIHAAETAGQGREKSYQPVCQRQDGSSRGDSSFLYLKLLMSMLTGFLEMEGML